MLQWTAPGYLVELVAGRGEKVRAPPVEVEVSELFEEPEVGETQTGTGEEAP